MAGILLQVCFPLQKLSLWLLLPVPVMLAGSFCFTGKHAVQQYHTRWVWGVLFSCIMIFMSIQATAYAERHLSDPDEPGWLLQQARTVQTRMVHKLDRLRLSDDEKSILSTITISYRHTMSYDMRRKFSALGVAHILSVSGFHVGILYGFLSLLLSSLAKRKRLRWIRIVLLFLSLWAFALVTGLSVATVRATLMTSVYLMGQAFQRRPDRYNTLAASAFLLLVYNPFFLFDIGFQLSFIAVLFIFWLHPPLSRLIMARNPVLVMLCDILTITTAAQAGTTFLCCYYFGTISTLFLITNLVLSLLAMALIPMAQAWMMLPDGIASWLVPLKWAIEQLMHCFVGFIDRYSMVPGATLSLSFDLVTTILAYISFGLLLLFLRYRQARTLIAALTVLLGIICWHIIKNL